MIFLAIILGETFFTPAVFAQRWVSTKVVGPFVCWGNFDLSEVETQLAGLSEVHQQLSEKLKLPVIQEWIEVYVFESDASWREFLREKYPKISYRRALFIKKKGARGQLFVCRTAEFAVDIRHEGTHALLDAAVSGVPEWLHEGLAEYFEVAPGSRLTGAEWFAETQRNAKFGISRKLTSLEKIRTGMSMTPKDYRDSWAWVNFLLNGPPEVRGILPEMIADFARTGKAAPVSTRIAKRIKNPDSVMRAYFHDLKAE